MKKWFVNNDIWAKHAVLEVIYKQREQAYEIKRSQNDTAEYCPDKLDAKGIQNKINGINKSTINNAIRALISNGEIEEMRLSSGPVYMLNPQGESNYTNRYYSIRAKEIFGTTTVVKVSLFCTIISVGISIASFIYSWRINRSTDEKIREIELEIAKHFKAN